MNFFEHQDGLNGAMTLGARPSVTIRSGISRELPTIAYLRELLKLKARSLIHREQTRRWLQLLNSHPAFSEYVRHCPRMLYKIYRPYLTSKLPMEGRLALLTSHYHFIFRRGLGQTVAQASRTAVLLATAEGKSGLRYALNLRAVGTLEREGELVLQLSRDGVLIYSVAFTFSGSDDCAGVSIGCIQGPNTADAQEDIRQATRELHGLRPKHLLVMLVRQLGHAMGCGQLRLVGNANRVVHSAIRQGRVRADYDQLWRELGATAEPDGDFQLRCEALSVPDMEKIASKKRSEARKRHELVAALSSAMIKRLCP